MTDLKKIAIVILNWNGEKLFPEFLPSIIRHSQEENIEIIVADNGSTDRSIEVLKKDFPEISVLDLKCNYGFALGYNMALRQISADYFVLVNSDVKVSEGWIKPCIQQMENDKMIAAVQPKVLSYHQPDSFEYAGAAGGFIDKYGYPFCRGRILNHVEKDEHQYDEQGEIFWATGACMFVRAKVFTESGGFDHDFWAHMEEIDLCWRLKNQGYKITYEPKSVIWHLGGGTLSYGSPRKIFLNFRNNLFMLFKNLPDYKFKRIMFIRMVLDGAAAAKFLAGFEWKAFLAVLKAHASFYKNLSGLIKKRRLLKVGIVKTEHAEICSNSIMWKFFVQKKQTFSSLEFKP